MMKSFFKKLAFVMALAMVVSAMAPAATAKAAEKLGICLQESTNWEVLETYEMTEGDEPQDFKFAGAPANWRTLGLTWDSTDKTVATVDQTGLVTVLAAGTTDITIAGGDYAGKLTLTVNPKANPLGFEAEMLSDNVAKLTFNDTTVTAANLKSGLEFFYYVAPGFTATVPLVEKIEAKGNGVFYATLYNTVYFNDGVVYGFTYKGYTDEFTCEIGEVAFAKLTVNGKDTAVVELSEDSVAFGAKLFNEKGKDITATALKKGVSIEYEVAEDEDGRFSAVDESSMIFHEAATATVKVTCFKLDDEGERIVLADALPYTVTAVKPEAYNITFNQAPAFTIVPVGTSAEKQKWPAVNSKLAVGDDGYELLVKLADNKSKLVGTDYTYYKNDGTQDGAWDEGTFKFESTNVSRLYVTEDGLLMPNAKGEVVVLLYYTSNAEDAEPQLVSAITLNVSAPRAVGETNLSVTKKTLSTTAVNKSNETTVTVEVRDSLGDKVGVEGLKAKVECTTTGTALKNGAVAPDLSTEAPVVTDGKLTFTISADETTVPTAGKSQIYNFKVTIDNKTETFSITVKAPTSLTSFSKYAMIFADAKIKDATDLNNMDLVVSLAGISNGVTAAKLDMTNAKLKAEDAVPTQYYYTVFKDGVDLTEKMAGKVVDGDLIIDLTTTKDIKIKETSNASEAALTVVDLVHGAGKYTVTVYEAKTDSKGKVYFNPLSGAKETYTVASELPSAAYVEKIAPTYSKNEDVKIAVMDCFKFTVGDKTFDSADDYAGYKIAINENVVDGGNVCYVNSVTFYKESKAGAYINCGTVTVGDYITFVTAE